MPIRFELHTEQARVWQRLLEERLPHGSKAKVAKDLARLEKQEVASWKTRISGFVKGEPQRLHDILGLPRRRRCVEKALKLSQGELLKLFRQAKGFAIDSDPFVVRVPGFEDLGPIPADSCPLTPNPASWSGPIEGAPNDLISGLLDRPKDSYDFVSVHGTTTCGRNRYLRYCAARLRRRGEVVCFWPERLPEATVIVAELADSQTLEQVVCFAEKSDQGCMLLLGSERPLRPRQSSRVWRISIIQLRKPILPWSVAATRKIEKFAEQTWDETFDLTPLRRWLAADPLSVLWIDSPDALGLLARHVVEGHALPPSADQLMENAISRTQICIRDAGFTTTAQVFTSIGAHALPALARLQVSYKAEKATFTQALVKASSGVLGPNHEIWRKLATPGMGKVVDELMAVGLFTSSPTGLAFSNSLLMQAALAVALGGGSQTLDQELLVEILNSNRYHLALVAARANDEVLEKLFKLPPAQLCRIPRFLAYVTSTSQGAPRDSKVLTQALSTLMWWYSHVQPVQQAVNHYREARLPSEALPPDPQISPLVLVAIATSRHTKHLPAKLGSPPAPLQEYATILTEGRDSDLKALRPYLLTLLAPWQYDEITSPLFWKFVHEQPNLHGLYRNSSQFFIWWNLAAPALVHHGGWRTLLGTKELLENAVSSGANQKPWRDAYRQAKAHDPMFAARTWGRTLSCLLRLGATEHIDSLQNEYSQCSSDAKLGLQDQARQILHEQVYYHAPVALLEWLFKDVLPQKALTEVWATWSKHNEVPWQLFLKCGLPKSVVAHTAIKLESQPWASDALNQLVSSGHYGTIERLALTLPFSRVHQWREKILQRAYSRYPACDRFRHELLCTRTWRNLLNDFVERGFKIDWRTLMRRANPTLSEMVFYTVAAALDSSRKNLVSARAALNYYCRWLEAPESPDNAAHRSWLRHLPRKTRWTLGYDEDPRHLLRLLAELLWLRDKSGTDVRGVFNLVISYPTLRKHIAGGVQAPLWRLLHKFHGTARTIAEMDTEAQSYGPRILSILGHRELTQEALKRHRLRAGLAQTLASPSISIAPEVFELTIQTIPLDPWDRNSAKLLSLYIRETGYPGVNLILSRLEKLPAEVARRYLCGILPDLPDGPLRVAILEKLFANS